MPINIQWRKKWLFLCLFPTAFCMDPTCKIRSKSWAIPIRDSTASIEFFLNLLELCSSTICYALGLSEKKVAWIIAWIPQLHCRGYSPAGSDWRWGLRWRHFGAKYQDMHTDYTGQAGDGRNPLWLHDCQNLAEIPTHYSWLYKLMADKKGEFTPKLWPF